MANPAADSSVTISVLDRLIDVEPKNSKEVPMSRAVSVRALRDAVRRDLEWLLNTRRIAVPPDEGLTELGKSVYVFGLPDFTSFSLNSASDKAKLIRQLQNTVRMFEPRVAKVKIVPIDPTEAQVRTLRFRIEGLLLMDPEPEHVSFDTVLQLTSGQYEVKNEG